MKVPRLGRKRLMPILGVLLVLLILAGGALAYRNSEQTKKRKIVEQTKAEVTEAFKGEGSCAQSVIEQLEKLYELSEKQEDKALHAEQAAHCKMISKQFDEAIEWYKKAESEYAALNNAEKVDYLKRSIENVTYIKDYQTGPAPTDLQEDRGEF